MFNCRSLTFQSVKGYKPRLFTYLKGRGCDFRFHHTRVGRGPSLPAAAAAFELIPRDSGVLWKITDMRLVGYVCEICLRKQVFTT